MDEIPVKLVETQAELLKKRKYLYDLVSKLK
jgi:hypothetical protein